MPSLRSGLIALAVAVAAGGLVAPSPAAAAGQVGACYAYKDAATTGISSTAPVVDCSAQHTAETYHVGTLPEAFGLPSKSSAAARLSAGRPCTETVMNAYLGMPDRELPSRFRTVILFPTDDQWAAGDRQFRCDVVLQGGLELKAFTGTAAALVGASPSTQFDFCTPREPNARRTAAYPCLSPKKNWIMVLKQELAGPSAKYPGDRVVERKAARICQKQGNLWNGKEKKYPGWWRLNPLGPDWAEGKRSVRCFVPYFQYLDELKLRAPKPVPAPTPTPTVTEPAPAV